jgi:hypothetical protein
MRKRKVVKYGDSCLIRLAPSDMIDFDLKKGDEVDIEDISKLNEEEKKDGRRKK